MKMMIILMKLLFFYNVNEYDNEMTYFDINVTQIVTSLKSK